MSSYVEGKLEFNRNLSKYLIFKSAENEIGQWGVIED